MLLCSSSVHWSCVFVVFTHVLLCFQVQSFLQRVQKDNGTHTAVPDMSKGQTHEHGEHADKKSPACPQSEGKEERLEEEMQEDEEKEDSPQLCLELDCTEQLPQPSQQNIVTRIEEAEEDEEIQFRREVYSLDIPDYLVPNALEHNNTGGFASTAGLDLFLTQGFFIKSSCQIYIFWGVFLV